MSALVSRFINSVDEVEALEWNALVGDGNPFLQHPFFSALEKTGCTDANSGWIPQHLCFFQDNALVAFLPLYEKHHSYGEYVFDWSWADAYHQHGFNYYPKLVSAIPYTPSTGSRLCTAPSLNRDHLLAQAGLAIKERCLEKGYSSWHCLFPTEGESGHWQGDHFSQRLGTQFHWYNRGYENFDDFLQTFNSRKRKNLKKERRRVGEQGVTLKVLEGENIDVQHWRDFYQFYHLTYFKRSGRQGYLSEAFFTAIGETLADKLVMIAAYRQDRLIAAALCFKDQHSLYGRYWGCREEVEHLHFEACYYQGIEYAINHGLKHFDPGAQGEHKIQRGFEPITTYSNHWIVRPDFRAAIDRFLDQERLHNERYRQAAEEYLPYKQGLDLHA